MLSQEIAKKSRVMELEKIDADFCHHLGH